MKSYGEPNIERLLRTFRIEKADRVPNFETIICEKNATYLLGRPCPQTDNMAMDPYDHLQIARKIGMDAIGFGIYWDLGRVHAQASDGSTHYVDGNIRSWDDLKGIKIPDIKPQLEKLEKYLEAAKGTNIGVWVSTHSVFDSTYLAVGYQDFMLKLYDDLKFVEYIMDLFLEFESRVVREIVERDIHFLIIGDDVAQKDGLMIQPELFRKLWVDRTAKIIEPAREKGIPLVFHSDGDLTEVMPLIIDLGFSAVHPVEPSSNNIYDLKKKYGNRICLVGNMDIAGPLAFGTPQDVEEDVRKHLEGLMMGGGYVAASSSCITDGIPPENFLAMVGAVHKYGRYEE